jgi:hypothetical protein
MKFECFCAIVFLVGVTMTSEKCQFQSSNGAVPTSNSIKHPTKENIPEDSLLADIIDRSILQVEEEAMMRIWHRLSRAREVVTIGILEGEQSDMIGEVKDIAVGESGVIYILDSRNNEVKVFNKDGIYLTSFGGPGEGPEEFMEPQGIEISDDGVIFVADRHRKVSIVSEKDQLFDFESSIVLEYAPESMCVAGKYIYIQGIQSEKPGSIQVLDYNGNSEGSIGNLYKTDNKAVQQILSNGPISCDLFGGYILQQFTIMPLVYSYSMTGKLLWVTRIADFYPMSVYEEKNEEGKPSIRFSPGKESFDHLRVLERIGETSYYVVQVARVASRSAPGQSKEYDELHAYIINGETGKGNYLGSEIPLIYYVSSSRIYAGENSPFPQVHVYKY